MFGGGDGGVVHDRQGRLAFDAAARSDRRGRRWRRAAEIRFVAAMVDPKTVQLNAPFTIAPAAGSQLSATVTYAPATDLPSVSIFDYWSPDTAVQRLLCGAGVDQMEILVNGDYHEVHFKGLAQDVVDSSSFAGGDRGLSSFPQEPALGAFDFSVVPGQHGTGVAGHGGRRSSSRSQAQTLHVKNRLETRAKEFGSSMPTAHLAGTAVGDGGVRPVQPGR